MRSNGVVDDDDDATREGEGWIGCRSWITREYLIGEEEGGKGGEGGGGGWD